MDAAVVKLDLGADEHLTRLLRVEPQLNARPVWKKAEVCLEVHHFCIDQDGSSRL